MVKKCKEHKQATCENETGTGVTVAVPTDSMGTFAVSKRHKHPITKELLNLHKPLLKRRT